MTPTLISATEASKNFGSFINTALQHPVTITKNNKKVLITITPQYLEDLIDGALSDQAMND
jgi:PHD/YefM family antitoxin component YafN of YafNO toxin-antitoxin module